MNSGRQMMCAVPFSLLFLLVKIQKRKESVKFSAQNVTGEKVTQTHLSCACIQQL